MKKKKPLTKRQQEFFETWAPMHKKLGRPPTLDEVIEECGMKARATPLHYYKALVKAGWAKRDGKTFIPVESA